MLVELYKPPPSKLNTHFILGEIIYNVNAMSELHPNIDTDMLRALAEGMRANKVETEDALRALCQIFRDTYSFDFSLERLESKIRNQVISFIDGKSSTAIAAHGLQAGAPFAGHHVFSHAGFTSGSKPEGSVHEHAAHKFIDKAKAKLSKRPIVYEDPQESKIMEV